MFRKRRPPVGSSPGELSKNGFQVPTRIHVIDYDKNHLTEYDVEQISDLEPLMRSPTVSWIDIQGLADGDALSEMGRIFSIHPLAIADVVNVPQRPKVEEYDDLLFIVSMVVETSEAPLVKTEQISIFLGPGFVITVQEDYRDIFNPIRERLRQGKGPITRSGADYLAYSLLDAIIDGFYPVLEQIGEYLEDLEERVIYNPTTDSLAEIHIVRRELSTLRRAVFPQRELINSLIREHSKLIKKPVPLYLRDCYDHCVQVIEVLESYREIAAGLMEVYLSCTSNRLNEVMKVLTMISTFFIPMSFLAGVFGMNFEYMPELKMRWAYPLFWLMVVFIAAGMALFFRRKGWIGGED